MRMRLLAGICGLALYAAACTNDKKKKNDESDGGTNVTHDASIDDDGIDDDSTDDSSVGDDTNQDDAIADADDATDDDDGDSDASAGDDTDDDAADDDSDASFGDDTAADDDSSGDASVPPADDTADDDADDVVDDVGDDDTDDAAVDDVSDDDTSVDDSNVDDGTTDDTSVDDSNVDDGTTDDTSVDDSNVDDAADDDTDDTSVDDSSGPTTVFLVVTSSNALGTVALNGEPCSQPACSVELIPGDNATINAIPGRGMEFTGWVAAFGDSHSCDAAECTITMGEQTTRMEAQFSSPHNLMFVTNYVNAYALGGLEGADETCAQDAEAAGLDGTYRAWLSTTTTDARDRLGSARGWVRIDGYPIADTAEDWATAKSLMPVAYNAAGERQEHMFWTGTNSDGQLGGNRPFYYEEQTLSPGSCGDWGELDPPLADGGRPPEGAAVGSSTGIGVRLSDTTTIDCDSGAGLLCVGVDKSTPLSFTPASGRVAFLSDARVAANEGIGAADTICQAEGAGLGGSFLAAIATSTTPLWDRFDLDGDPWVRVDGIPFVADAADLANSHEVLTGLNVLANGELVVSYDAADTFALTGGDFDGELEPEQTCQDWSVSGGTDNTMFGGDPQSGSDNSLGCCRSGCTQERRVFCLQE